MLGNIKKVVILNKHVGAVITGITMLALAIINFNCTYYSRNINNIALEIADNNGFYELGNELISEYQTTYNEQNINRTINIKLATKKVNGTIILPNEVFSYNNIVGDRTEEEGYKLATVYQNGKMVEGLGGGVCQLSSTIYNATLYANLEIIERKSHLFLPSYSNVGGDAAVAEGYIDFKFKNTRKYPIKLVCSANNGVLNVKIYGKKQKDECDIQIKSKIIKEMPYEIVYENSENLALGEQKLIQIGKLGYKSKTYKIISFNNKIISKTLISVDTYSPMNEVFNVGIK